ncbi:MAG: DUF3413 domain-containing protein [Gammaproteobacteria bacterium]|nr:DUF3413 domain-containing protein [Gammaproteobacteria bacterium]
MVLSTTYPQTRKAIRQQLLCWSGWFFCANIVLVLLISMRYLFSVEIPKEPLALLFSIIAFIGHFASLAFLCYVLLLPFIYLLPTKPVILAFANILAVGFVFIITVDTFIFAQYHFHFNSMVISLLFGGAANEIFIFSSNLWMFAITGLLLIVIVEIALSRMIWNWSANQTRRRHGTLLASILVSVFLVQNVAYAWADAQAYTPITKQIRYLPGYKPLTAKRFFVKYGWVTTNNTPQLSQARQQNDLNYPKTPFNCTGPETKNNVLVIVLDSWRADSLNTDTTPNIQQFANNAWIFNDHFSGANSTRIGIFSLFYGIPGTYWHTMLAENQGALLVEELINQNFQMGIFASASLTSPEFNRTVFTRINNLRLRSKGKTPHDRDRNITDDVKIFIDSAIQNEQPVFGFLFYDTPHAYDFPRDYPLKFKPSWNEVNFLKLDQDFDPKPFLNRYKNAVHFADSLVGEVLDKLKNTGLMENTVVIITSDHGQEFNDSGLNYWGHNSNYSKYQTKVPLVVKWPGKPPQRFSHRTSHFDIAPTLIKDVLGCSNPHSDYSSGKHLLDANQAPYLIISNYSSYAIMENSHTTVVDEFGQIDVFDNENYQRLEDKTISPSVILNVMNDMAQFYKH